MRPIFKILFSFFVLSASAMCHAQILSIDSVLYAIEKNNPMLRMYDSRIQASDAYSKGAKSWMPPQAGAGFYMTPYDPRLWRADGMTNGMGSFMVSAEQMFPNMQKQNANYNYMKSMGSVQAEGKGFQLNQLLSEAKMAYYDWAVMEKKKVVLTENEALLKYIIKSSEIHYQYQNEKLGSIYKAQAQLAELKNMQLMLDNEIAQKRIMLNTLMNRDKNLSFEIDTNISLKNYETVSIDTSLISASRSDIKGIDRMIDVNILKQKVERSQRLPEVGLRYDHMFTFGGQPQQFSLMGMITIPIAPWSSRMWKANVQGINLEIEAMREEKKAITNEASGTIETLKSRIFYQKRQIETTQRDILPALQKNYQTSLLAFEQNNGELFVALDAWQMLKMTQLNYIDQIQQLLLLQVDYEKQLQIR